MLFVFKTKRHGLNHSLNQVMTENTNISVLGGFCKKIMKLIFSKLILNGDGKKNTRSYRALKA